MNGYILYRSKIRTKKSQEKLKQQFREMTFNRLNRYHTDSDDEDIATESNFRDESRRRRKVKKRNPSSNFSASFTTNGLPLESGGNLIGANKWNTSLPCESIRRHHESDRSYQNKKLFRSFVIIDTGSGRDLPLVKLKKISSPDTGRQRYACQPVEMHGNFNLNTICANGSDYCFVSPDLNRSINSNSDIPDLLKGKATNVINRHQQTAMPSVWFDQLSDNCMSVGMTNNETSKTIHHIQMDPKLNGSQMAKDGNSINKSKTWNVLPDFRPLSSVTSGNDLKNDSVGDTCSSSSESLDFHLTPCSKHQHHITVHSSLTKLPASRNLVRNHSSPILMMV